MSRKLLRELIACSVALCVSSSLAQEPSPRWIIDKLDRNKNGMIEKEEVAKWPGHFRAALKANRVSLPISRDDFFKRLPGIMQSNKEFSDRERAEKERREYEQRAAEREKLERRAESDRERERARYQTESRYRTTPRKPADKPRVTVDLPEKYGTGDTDRDGQVSLFEWRKWKPKEIAKFFEFDANRDGILTPRELQIAENAANPKASQKAKQPTAKQDKSTTPEARWVFRQLDRDRDGELSDEEWQRSRTTRYHFGNAGIEFDRPIDVDGFIDIYPDRRLFPQVRNLQ